MLLCNVSCHRSMIICGHGLVLFDCWCIWYASVMSLFWLFGGGVSQAATFSAMMALAYGHDVALPCFMPHRKSACVVPCLVIIVTGT